MNRACKWIFTNRHEKQQHASSIRPLKNNSVRMRKVVLYCQIFSLIITFKQAFSQTNTNFCALGNTIFNEINAVHYHQLNMNDAWSAKIWLYYISEIDPQGLYLTQPDYKYLSSFKDSIDDYLQNSNCTFFSKFLELFKNRVITADSLVKQILQKPLNYNQPDTLIIYNENQQVYAKNRHELLLTRRITYCNLNFSSVRRRR